jgi:hypothetical protein
MDKGSQIMQREDLLRSAVHLTQWIHYNERDRQQLTNPVPLIWAIFHRVTLSRRRQLMADGRSSEFHSTHFGQLRGMAEALSRYIARYDERPRVAEGQHWHQSSLFESPCSISSQCIIFFIFDLPIFRNMCNKLFMNTFLGSQHLCPWKTLRSTFPTLSLCEVDSLWISTIWYVSFLQFLRWALRKIAKLVLFDSVYVWQHIYIYLLDITRTYFYGNRTRKEDGEKESTVTKLKKGGRD